MTNINDALPPSALLRRKRCAEALTAHGFPVAEKTLATKASRGGGPAYRKFGRLVLYQWADALAWAEAQLSPPVGSSSELAERIVQRDRELADRGTTVARTSDQSETAAHESHE
jgi:hypothetical protein